VGIISQLVSTPPPSKEKVYLSMFSVGFFNERSSKTKEITKYLMSGVACPNLGRFKHITSRLSNLARRSLKLVIITANGILRIKC
jgi:hypothetical protein